MKDIPPPPDYYYDPIWSVLASHRPIPPILFPTTLVGAILDAGLKARLAESIPHGEVGPLLDGTAIVIFVVPDDLLDDGGPWPMT